MWKVFDKFGAEKQVISEYSTIRGAVSSAGAVTKGSGFTVSKPSTGIYVITFTTAFPSVPAVVVTPNGSPYIAFALTNGITTTSVAVQFFNPSSVAVDIPFDFIAMAA